MKILCPNCGVKGSADDSYCDRRVKCPKCQNIFVVQADMALELEAAPQPDPSSLFSDDPADMNGIKKGVEFDSNAESIDDHRIEDGTAEQEAQFDHSEPTVESEQQKLQGDTSAVSDSPDMALDSGSDIAESDELPDSEIVGMAEAGQEEILEEDEPSLLNDAEDIENDTAKEAEIEDESEQVDPLSEEAADVTPSGKQPSGDSSDADYSDRSSQNGGFSIFGMVKKFVNFVRSKKSK